LTAIGQHEPGLPRVMALSINEVAFSGLVLQYLARFSRVSRSFCFPQGTFISP